MTVEPLERIVVIDDVPANGELLRRLLATDGLTDVDCFTSPIEALGACAERVPALVMLDLHMPQMDGIGVLRHLQSIAAADGYLPVIMLTADITDEARDEALGAGVKDFLTKPFDRTEVLLRVRNLLETHRLYSQLRERNGALRAELDEQLARERRLLEQQQEQQRLIDEIVREGLLEMVFQRFVRFVDNEVVGVEALARFSVQPVRPPNEWFAEAESAGRLAELETHAVRRATSRLADLPDDAFMSVNVSPATAITDRFVQLLLELPLDRIVLELTEHAPVDDYDGLVAALAPLRSLGMRVAVDDAGAGYAGLQHILRLNPDVIKLDIALTRGIDIDPARRALATALVRFSSEIGATLIAEGIETESEMTSLRELGIDWGQGYFLGRPAPITDFARVPRPRQAR